MGFSVVDDTLFGTLLIEMKEMQRAAVDIARIKITDLVFILLKIKIFNAVTDYFKGSLGCPPASDSLFGATSSSVHEVITKLLTMAINSM